MTRARSRKTPITARYTSKATSPNPRATRHVIRKFHALLKRKTLLEQPHACDTRSEELEKVQEEIQGLGGLENYQRMSASGQAADRGGSSAKILIQWLTDLQKRPLQHDADQRLKLLEIGALEPDNYRSCASWIEVLPIDLNARKTGILQQDFFALDTVTNSSNWDIISISLVLNFVPTPQARGLMLQLCHAFMKLGGLLFVVLPSPCLFNSRYLDSSKLHSLMKEIGFDLLRVRSKEGGKMVYLLYSKAECPSEEKRNWAKFKKKYMCHWKSTAGVTLQRFACDATAIDYADSQQAGLQHDKLIDHILGG